MILVILHFHFRPGGVRRVIEQGTPAIVQLASRGKVDRVILVNGEPIPPEWLGNFRTILKDVPVDEKVWEAAQYSAEKLRSAPDTWRALLLEWRTWFSSLGSEEKLLWTHNLSVGRNASLAHALAEFARMEPEMVQVWSCHDFWFDGRLQRWPEMQTAGARSVQDVEEWLFPRTANVRFACINHIDYQMLQTAVGWRAVYLPNIAEAAKPVSENETEVARSLFKDVTGDVRTPAWLLPCRVLRRKNIAESFLLTRLLRPRAWLVTTGQAGSPAEKQYGNALTSYARTHRWRLHLGILGKDTPGLPTVGAMIGAAETILLTSVQEGFGLPFLEAAAARKPLVARVIPNVMPDLTQAGLRFPQTYDELLVPVSLLQWETECQRQYTWWEKWRSSLPPEWFNLAGRPPGLEPRRDHVPFSRLTLDGQLEILSHSDDELARSCLELNPRLRHWREQAERGTLAATEWPAQIEQYLSPQVYARRFWAGADSARLHQPAGNGQSEQEPLARLKLASEWIFPLLW